MPKRMVKYVPDTLRLREALDSLRPWLLTQVKEAAAQEMAHYRQRVKRSTGWCCPEMVAMADQLWGSRNVRPGEDDTLFGTSFQIRGHAVNFCPNCGQPLDNKR